VLAWIRQQQDKQPRHRGDLVSPRLSNQKAGLMKDRVDRLAQGTSSRTRPARLGRRCDGDVSAAPAQAASEPAE
jgi:3-phenylpropionate/cinnamic acid dioxygenase small subunit